MHTSEDEYQAAEIRRLHQPERGSAFCLSPTASKCITMKEQSCYY